MDTAKQSLLKILQEEAQMQGAGPRAASTNLRAAIAKGELQNLALEEERERVNTDVFRFGSLRDTPDLYGTQGAQRHRAQGVEDADRARAQQLALQDIRNQHQQSSLRDALASKKDDTPRVNPISDPWEGKRTDPFVETVLFNNATIPTGAATNQYGFSEAAKQMGFNPSSPFHLSIAKEEVQKALTSGKPVDAAALRSTINDRLFEAEKKQLEQQTSLKKMKDLLGEEGAKDAWGKAAKNKIEGSLLSLSDQAGAFMRIAQGFDNRFLTAVPALMQGYSSVKERLESGKLSAEEKNLLARYTRFRVQTVQAFNGYRKEITGAGASNQELEKLEKGFVNMNLSPTEFKAALGALQDATTSKMLLLQRQRTSSPSHISTTDPEQYINNIRDGIIEDELDAKLAKYIAKYDNWAAGFFTEGRIKELDSLPSAVVYQDEDGRIKVDEQSMPLVQSVPKTRLEQMKQEMTIEQAEEKYAAMIMSRIKARGDEGSVMGNAVAQQQANMPAVHRPISRPQSQGGFPNLGQYPQDVQQSILQNQFTKGGLRGN